VLVGALATDDGTPGATTARVVGAGAATGGLLAGVGVWTPTAHAGAAAPTAVSHAATRRTPTVLVVSFDSRRVAPATRPPAFHPIAVSIEFGR